MEKVAIYVRVSNKFKQDTQRQLSELRLFAEKNQLQVIEEIEEKISGAKTNRAGINRLIELAKNKKISTVLIHEVSRLGRNTYDALGTLSSLTDNNVCLYILNSNIRTLNSDGSRNELAQTLFTLMAEFARVERSTLIDRINSGLNEARRRGKTLGRKTGSLEEKEVFLQKHKDLKKYMAKDISLRDISKSTGKSVNTIRKYKSLIS